MHLRSPYLLCIGHSIDCYEAALQLVASVPLLETASSYLQKTLKTHFGSAWNELGTHYMVVSSSLDYAQGKISKHHRTEYFLW